MGVDVERKKILVVDDEQGVLKVLETRLSVVGYAVPVVDNGKDAIDWVRSEHPYR